MFHRILDRIMDITMIMVCIFSCTLLALLTFHLIKESLK
jgi:hypothetical protein